MKIIFFAISYAFLTFSYAKVLFGEILHYGFGYKKQHYFYFAFIITMIVLFKILKTDSFWATLKHELAHTFFSLLSFNSLAELHVNQDKTGSIKHYGNSNHLIYLAPYFFPISAISLMLISFLFRRPGFIFYILLGIVLAFDLITIYKDIHPYQTDLKRYNFFINLTAIIFWNMFFLGTIYSFVNGSFPLVWKFIKAGVYYYWNLVF